MSFIEIAFIVSLVANGCLVTHIATLHNVRPRYNSKAGQQLIEAQETSMFALGNILKRGEMLDDMIRQRQQLDVLIETSLQEMMDKAEYYQKRFDR